MSHKITDKWQKFLRENKQEFEGKILDKEDGEYQKSIEKPVRMKQEADCGGGRDYDEGPEASMHRTALATIRREAEDLLALINDSDDLPEWLETKITKAKSYLSGAKDYLAGEMEREQGALQEKAVSKAQQRFMGAVKNCKETGDCGSPEIKKAADSMTDKEVSDFAGTKHKGLPNKVKKEELRKRVREAIIRKLSEENLSEAVKYHLENKLPVSQNIFRPGSEQFFALFKEVRKLYNEGKYELHESEEYYILETSDLGEWGVYEGNKVPLDYPFLYEDEELEEAKYKGKEVTLGAKGAKRSGDGKAYVYVRDPQSGNIRKVSFGSSMPDAMGDSEAARKRRKNFGDRHNCADKKDKTKAGYWACRATKMFGRDISGWW